MKNANVFVDVDLTLVDVNGKTSWTALTDKIIHKHID